MIAVKSMNVRDHFKEWCNKVINGETIIVSRPKNENIVMMSEAQRNADYLAMLDKSMSEAESGGVIVKTIGELENL